MLGPFCHVVLGFICSNNHLTEEERAICFAFNVTWLSVFFVSSSLSWVGQWYVIEKLIHFLIMLNFCIFLSRTTLHIRLYYVFYLHVIFKIR